MSLVKLDYTSSDSISLCHIGSSYELDIGVHAWEVTSPYYSDLNRIEINYTLEYLTTMEADISLINWFNALKINGSIYIKTMDADFFAKLWLESDWNEQDLRNSMSNGRQAFKGLFGSQLGSNPQFDDYDALYLNVKKSAYNSRRLKFLLERVGFVDVHVEGDNKGNLVAHARKSMHRGERQVATSYENIRDDHKERYQFACNYLANLSPKNILDLACGIGYGSLMLSDFLDAYVTGVDIDQGAIEYASTYFKGNKTSFIKSDALELNFLSGSVDAIVSFETIEHIDFDRKLLEKFYDLLKPEGIMICSTPNEDVMPFNKEQFKFHVKHYKVSEISSLIEQSGFCVVDVYSQLDSQKGGIVKSEEGCFTILVCKKVV